MPTRIIREGIIASEPINSLSPESELFYRRLMSIADDYGRYYANPSLLLAGCYPLQLSKVSQKMVSKWLEECVKSGVLVVYGGGKWILIPNFRQQVRGPSKFPEPNESELLSNCEAGVNSNLSTKYQAPYTSSTTTTSSTAFSKPTLDEVKAEGVKIGLAAVGCEAFFHYYESNGWKVGKNAMKSWTSAMQNWKRNSVGGAAFRPTRKPYTPNL